MKRSPTDDILLLTLSLLHDLDLEEQRGEYEAKLQELRTSSRAARQDFVSGMAKVKADLKEAGEATVAECK